MSKICPKCSHVCDDNDIYCPRCAQKLIDNNVDIQQISESLKNTEVFNDVDKKEINSNRKFSEYFSASKISIFENSLFTFLIYIIIISIIVVMVLFFILNSHTEKKSRLDYQNMIENPSLIPRINDTKSYLKLSDDFISTQNFLLAYFKYSKDSTENKEQVFAKYLNELEKLSYISTINMDNSQIKNCSNINSYIDAKKCASNLNKKFKNTSIIAIPDYNAVYLYPNNKFIKNKFSKYLGDEFKNYINLRAKYNTPVACGLNLKISPKKLADKIADFEKLYTSTDNSFIKESIEKTLYNDVKKFIFTPSIYATTTQEMSYRFKNAYMYYINFKKSSSFRPIIMNVLDKGRGYSEENFKSDYPYKIYESDFDENVEKSSFSDIFANLRKGFFNSNDDVSFKYIYDSVNGSFVDYKPNQELKASQFLLADLDENNNIPIFTSSYSPFQELNIQKYSQFFILYGKLYTYNKDRLSISQILYNGKIFTTRTLSPSDISTLFPGINVINIDSYQTYNIVLNKANTDARYIIVSKYSQGFSDYELDSVRGEFSQGKLPNIFSVNSNSDTILSFHAKDVEADETSENSPTYKFVIKTGILSDSGEYIEEEPEQTYAQYDSETEIQQAKEHVNIKPNIMPKIEHDENDDDEIDPPPISQPAPKLNIEPPKEAE